MTTNIFLMGDSVFDNWAYVKHTSFNCETIQQLWKKLDRNKFTPYLVAIDGATISGIESQKERIPKNEKNFIFLSVSGNDLLKLQNKLVRDNRNLTECFKDLYNEIPNEYEEMIKNLIKTHPLSSIVLCTIYMPRVESWLEWIVAYFGVNLMNYNIRKIASEYNLPVIDLYYIFDENKDYANPIEPSAFGSDKITSLMIHIIDNHNFDEKTEFYLKIFKSTDPEMFIDSEEFKNQIENVYNVQHHHRLLEYKIRNMQK